MGAASKPSYWQSNVIAAVIAGLFAVTVAYYSRQQPNAAKPVQLAVVVTDAETGAALRDVQVILEHASRREERRTDNLGVARFQVMPDEGPLHVYVTPNGFDPFNQELDPPQTDYSYKVGLLKRVDVLPLPRQVTPKDSLVRAARPPALNRAHGIVQPAAGTRPTRPIASAPPEHNDDAATDAGRTPSPVESHRPPPAPKEPEPPPAPPSMPAPTVPLVKVFIEKQDSDDAQRLFDRIEARCLTMPPFTVVKQRAEADAIIMCPNCGEKNHPILYFQRTRTPSADPDSYRLFKIVVDGQWHFDLNGSSLDICNDFLKRKVGH